MVQGAGELYYEGVVFASFEIPGHAQMSLCLFDL